MTETQYYISYCSKTTKTTHVIDVHTSCPSSLNCFGSPPASVNKVGNQSETCIKVELVNPVFLRSGEATIPTPRKPPSHQVNL